MYKFIYLFHIFFSFLLIITIFLQKGSSILHGFRNYFQPNIYISRRFFLNLSVIFLFFFLITNFFLVYILMNSFNFNESYSEFSMLLFSNKYFDVFFLEGFEFPIVEPIWWN